MKSATRRYIIVACLFALCAFLNGDGFMPKARAQGGICGGIPCASNQGGSTSEKLTDLTNEAKRIVPTFIQTVHDPLGDYFNNLAYLLAYIVAAIFIMRLVRQSGDTEDIYWSMVRMALLFALLGFVAYRSPTSGQGADFVTVVSRVGNGIAYGGQGDDYSFLGRKVRQHQTKFSNGYSQFVDNTFKYRINGEDRLIEYPDDDATGGQILTVPNSGGDALQKVANALQSKNGWDMDNLFQFLNISRGVLEFGDLFLLILQGFLLAAVKMAAPFVVAISIDREFSSRIGKNFAWGSAVVLIVMPIVSQLVRWCAYTVGSIPFGKVSNPYFVYDATHGTVVVNGNPEYMVIICGVVMMICGLCMFASPFISYKLAQGGVFEAIAGTVSGWMGAMIGTGISMWSSATGASFSRQAAETSASANAGAESVTAAGAYRSAIIGANAKHSADVARSQTEMMSGINSAQIEDWASRERAGVAANEKIAGYNTQANETLINNEGKRRAESFGAEVGLDQAAYGSWGVFGGIVQEGRDMVKNVGGIRDEANGRQPGKYSDYLGGFGQQGDAPFSPQAGGGGGGGGGGFRPSAVVNGRESYQPADRGNFSLANQMQSIKSAYRAKWGTEMPTGAVGQGNVHNQVGYDHRNSMDARVGPNTPQGQWLRGYLADNNIPYNAFSKRMISPTTGKLISQGPHIHIGASSHSSGGQTWPLGTIASPSVGIPQGNQTIRNAPFPVVDKLLPYEKTRIETGAGDAAARYGAAARSSAAITEYQGLSRIAATESSFKQRIAVAANAGRIHAAGIEVQGATNSAKVTLNAADTAIRTRYEGALKSAAEQRIGTIISTFGSTIANQAQGAMQQYNRF